eukprot:scaffold53_cov193-Pinguiococcus_pyrenoidosus.AAC.70
MLRIDFSARQDKDAMEQLWLEYLPSKARRTKAEVPRAEGSGASEAAEEKPPDQDNGADAGAGAGADAVDMARTFVMQRAALGGTLLEVNEKLREDADLDAALGRSIEHCFIAILEPNAQQAKSFLTMAERPENGVQVSVSVGASVAEPEPEAELEPEAEPIAEPEAEANAAKAADARDTGTSAVPDDAIR